MIILEHIKNQAWDKITPEMIREARISLKLTQREIGEYIGIAPKSWERIENKRIPMRHCNKIAACRCIKEEADKWQQLDG